MKYRQLILSLSLGVGLAGLSFAQTRVLNVKVQPQFSKAALRYAHRYGQVSHYNAKTGEFELTVGPKANRQQIALDLLKERAVVSVTGEGVHIPKGVQMQSRQFLKDELAKYPSDGPVKDPKNEVEDGPDYLRALQYFNDRRAYPYDRIDWNAYSVASVHAAHMPAANWLVGGKKGTHHGGGIHANFVDPLTGQWSLIGPNNLNIPYTIYYGVPPLTGRVNAVAYDTSNPSTYYLGGAEGGVWKTTDSGAHWTCLSNSWSTETVDSLAVDPTNTQIIYAAIGDVPGGIWFPGGIMKSTDGGNTWNPIGQSVFGDQPMSTILIDPDNHNRLIAASGWYKGIFVSTDGGTTWNNTLNDSNNAFVDLSYGIPNGSGVRDLYAIDNNSLWVSTDRGSSWTQANSTFSSAKSVAASAVSATSVYVLDGNNQAVYKSTNAGTTLTNVTGNLGSVSNWSQAWYDYYLRCQKVAGQDDLFVGLISVAESQTGGNTWADIGLTETNSAPTHNDAHAIMLNPANPNQALFGNDGGVYVANRVSGTTWNWTPLNQGGLCLTMFYDARWRANDPNSMIGGSQDNATPVATGDVQNWGNVAGGDGGGVAIDKDNEAIQYATVYDFSIYQTTNNWASENYISPNTGNDNLPFVTPIFGDPAQGNLMYGCTNYLYRYDSNTSQWTSHLGNQLLTSGSLVNTVGISPSNNQVLYTGSDSGDLYRSANKGASWTKINTASLPNRAITSISVNPSNPNDILVGLSGSGTGHIYECTNTAATSPVFTSVSGSNNSALPDVSLNCIARDPLDPVNTLYVGTDIGVFASNNAGTTWYNATIPLGLPAVQVTAIQVTNYRGLNVSTYGRGIWRLNILTTNVQNPVSYTVLNGSQVSGNLASLYADDGNDLVVYPGFLGAKGYRSTVTATFTIPAGQTVTSLAVQTKTTGQPTVPIQLLVLNPTTNQYVSLGTVTSGADGSITIPGNISQYISNSNQVTIAVQVAYPKPTIQSLKNSLFDRINLSVTSY